jgi:hypothetical protein
MRLISRRDVLKTALIVDKSPSGFALRAPKQMAGAIWDGLTRSRA